MIILDTDLQGVTDLRATNHSIRLLIDNHPQYSLVFTHYSQLLRGLLATKLASWFTISAIFESVVKDFKCRACGNYGPFVYLLTCSRVCRCCMLHDHRYFPCNAATARRDFNLTQTTLKRGVPTLHTLPGHYAEAFYDSPVGRRRGVPHYKKRYCLVDFEQTLQLAKRRQGSDDVIVHKFVDQQGRILPKYLQADNKSKNPRRYMGVIHVPWLDTEHEIIEDGLSCRSCFDGDDDRRPVFTIATFEEHVKECAGAKALLEIAEMDGPCGRRFLGSEI